MVTLMGKQPWFVYHYWNNQKLTMTNTWTVIGNLALSLDLFFQIKYPLQKWFPSTYFALSSASCKSFFTSGLFMLDGSSTCSLHEVCLKILATFLSHWLSPFDWNVHCWNSSWFGSWQMSADRSRNLLTWNNPLISKITILYSQSPENQEHLSQHPISELLTVHWATSRNVNTFQKVFVSPSLNTPPAYKSMCMSLVSHKPTCLIKINVLLIPLSVLVPIYLLLFVFLLSPPEHCYYYYY